MPAAISEETGKYQVSWTEEHEKAGSGTYSVTIYDEDGFAAVRKVAEIKKNCLHLELFSSSKGVL